MRKLSGKFIILAATAVLLALFFAFNLQHYLTLDYLKTSREQFGQVYEASPVLVAGCYFLIFVASFNPPSETEIPMWAEPEPALTKTELYAP